MLSEQEVLSQSKAAFSQWSERWKKQSKENGDRWRELGCPSHQDLLYQEAGKTFLAIASGPSFEDNIEIVKKYWQKDSIVIGCVDKCMSDLVKNGITPDYVFLADAGINYEEWCEPYLEETKDMTLVSNITANPRWSKNWKGPVYYYVNKDNIQSEKIFTQMSGYHETIPAGSNVGNSVLIFSTQLLGCAEWLLLGYDFAFGPTDNYYAFNDSIKRYWMNHTLAVDITGKIVNTSQNLLFSSKWLTDFYTGYMQPMKLVGYNCSGKGILSFPQADLEKKLRMASRFPIAPEHKDKIVQDRMKQYVCTNAEELKEATEKLKIHNIVINYVTDKTENLVRSI